MALLSPAVGLDTAVTGLPKPASWEVPPDRSSVPASRRAIKDQVTAWNLGLPEEVVTDALLCASEVITNAVVHTGQIATVTLRWPGARLRVEVTDYSLRLPQAPDPDDHATGGRGLALVGALALAWDWHPAGAGKTVWFETGVQPTTTGGKRLTVLTRVAHHRTTD